MVLDALQPEVELLCSPGRACRWHLHTCIALPGPVRLGTWQAWAWMTWFLPALDDGSACPAIPTTCHLSQSHPHTHLHICRCGCLNVGQSWMPLNVIATKVRQRGRNCPLIKFPINLPQLIVALADSEDQPPVPAPAAASTQTLTPQESVFSEAKVQLDLCIITFWKIGWRTYGPRIPIDFVRLWAGGIPIRAYTTTEYYYFPSLSTYNQVRWRVLLLLLLLLPDRWDNKYTECRQESCRSCGARTSFYAVAALYWKMCAQIEKSCRRVTCLGLHKEKIFLVFILRTTEIFPV